MDLTVFATQNLESRELLNALLFSCKRWKEPNISCRFCGDIV